MPTTPANTGFPVLDDGFNRLLHSHYARMREEGPVHRALMRDGMPVWVVTRYDEARVALSDPRFSKDFARFRTIMQARRPPESKEFASSLAAHMLNMDPPDHTRLRKLVLKAFTPRRVEALRPRIEEITAELLDAMAEQSEVELLDAFAFPLPIQVISELLGVGESRRDEFREWSNAVVSGEFERAQAAFEHMATYLVELIAHKREHPGDDLMTALIEATEDSDRLTESELVAMVFLLLVAGHETTVNLIGNCVLALLDNPDQFAALKADPDLAANAIEEALRYNGPVNTATFRHTREAVQLGDVEIPEGELVLVALSSANRDGDRFADADSFEITRSASGHVAFGHGIHFCLGAPLARLEGQIAIRRLVERFPNLEATCPLGDLTWRTSTLMRGLDRFPVRLNAKR